MNPHDIFELVFDRFAQRYGPQHWWPADTPFEVMIGAILTQAASWINVEMAISNLKNSSALTPVAIRELGEHELAQLIYPSGYYNQKARKLKALAKYIGERFQDNLESMKREDPGLLKEELLDIYGIGEETADAILLYAVDVPVFVVDNYTRRIFERLGVIAKRAKYVEISSLFAANLASRRNIFGEYHALIVRHGKDTCSKVPECDQCCLLDICAYGLQHGRTDSR